MPKEKIKGLMDTLRETLGDEPISAQQKQLMSTLEYHIHNVDEPDPKDPTFNETLSLLVEELEEEHPQGAAVVRKIQEVLESIGI